MIPWEVEKNLYRLSAELTEIINNEISNLKEKALKYIVDELDIIEKLLDVENTDTESIVESIRVLKNLKIEENLS